MRGAMSSDGAMRATAACRFVTILRNLIISSCSKILQNARVMRCVFALVVQRNSWLLAFQRQFFAAVIVAVVVVAVVVVAVDYRRNILKWPESELRDVAMRCATCDFTKELFVLWMKMKLEEFAKRHDIPPPPLTPTTYI